MLHKLFKKKPIQNKANKNSLLGAVGNTPLVRLNHHSDILGTNVYAKLEFFNPGLSAKDRIIAHIIDKAEKSGKLKPGGTIIDATSGNTGCLLYTSPSPRDRTRSRMPSSA